eukprot:2988792-Rhodomonas_salina.2
MLTWPIKIISPSAVCLVTYSAQSQSPSYSVPIDSTVAKFCHRAVTQNQHKSCTPNHSNDIQDCDPT